jgi:hypothetical protein
MSLGLNNQTSVACIVPRTAILRCFLLIHKHQRELPIPPVKILARGSATDDRSGNASCF